MITLFKMDKGIGRDLDNSRTITLLNTVFKIIGKILSERLQSAAEILLGHEPTYSVKAEQFRATCTCSTRK